MVPLVGVLAVLSIGSTHASASAVREIDLPEGARHPLGIGVDEKGRVWVTLSTSWELVRYDPMTGEMVRVDLATPKEGSYGLWMIRFGSDGRAWTMGHKNLHAVDVETLEARAFPLPRQTTITGDVHIAADGTVWGALPTEDMFVRLDPETGEVRAHPLPERRVGPIEFEDADGTLYFTATYGDTVGALDPTSGSVKLFPEDVLESPVGLVADGDVLWVAEHGHNTLARYDPATNATERFPTAPSPRYPISGPSGLARAPDGAIWFAEHFTDRISRFDPVDRTLIAWEIPSGPRTDNQALAVAPDGTVWFPSYAKDKFGYVRYGGEEPRIRVPETAQVRQGASVRVPAEGAKPVSVGTPLEGLEGEADGQAVVLTAVDVPPGEYHVLVSARENGFLAGRYLALTVEPARAIPVAPPGGLLLVLLAVGFTLRGHHRNLQMHMQNPESKATVLRVGDQGPG